MELFSLTGVECMKAFNKLTPYDLDHMCEKIYVRMERGVCEKRPNRSTGKLVLPFSLADYKHYHMMGMRDCFFDMIAAQKTSFEHYVEAMRAASFMEREVTAEEIEKHRQMYADDTKDSASSSVQDMKSNARKSA